jgi:hypothetical protein
MFLSDTKGKMLTIWEIEFEFGGALAAPVPADNAVKGKLKVARHKKEERKTQKFNKLNCIKYIAYCRKSTDEKDKQVLSIETQIAELKEFAKRENLTISEFISESKTAKVPGRELHYKRPMSTKGLYFI